MTLKARMLWCVTAAVACAAVYAGDALAGDATVYSPGDLRHSTTVHIERVNFHRLGDVAALYDRITYAANQVCGPRSLTGSYYTSPGYTRCYTEAVNDAVGRVNHPELTTYHRAHLARGSHLASN